MKKLLAFILALALSLSSTTAVLASSDGFYMNDRIGHPVVAFQPKGDAPFTYSQTKLDYPYNIYVEDKGYIDFGDNKPFLDENGALYLPIEQMAYLSNKTYFEEPETGNLVFGIYYTEENTPYKAYSRGFEDKPILYNTKIELKAKPGSNVVYSESHYMLTDWGYNHILNGGRYIDPYDGSDLGAGPNYRIVSDSSHERDHKVITKNGVHYWEKSAIMGVMSVNLLTHEVDKTYIHGSDEYLTKMLLEVVEPSLGMDEKEYDWDAYDKMMDDVFSNAWDISKVTGNNSENKVETEVTEDTSVKAIKTSSAVMVDGVEVKFDAYNINNNNYFKLRDIAQALNGSNSQFNVGWDSGKNMIVITKGLEYSSVGGELQTNSIKEVTAIEGDVLIYMGGAEIEMMAYNINGNNYFKLRELGSLIDFDVDWDGVNNRVLISTK